MGNFHDRHGETQQNAYDRGNSNPSRERNRERHDCWNEERSFNRSIDNKFNVLDLGCGKGGDLPKWNKAGVDHVTFVDIAQISVEQAEARYRERNQRFGANFLSADCTKTRLLDVYPENIQGRTTQNNYQQVSSGIPKFDIVSCQFAFHYSFETEAQAECMVRNAADCLRPGGFFIGTIPDAQIIWQRLREVQMPSSSNGKAVERKCSHKFGNSVYSVEFDGSSPALVETTEGLKEELYKDRNISGKIPDSVPKFGVGYNFYLDGRVDCPEFLVNFDKLCDIADRHGLMLVAKQGFENFFKTKRNTRDGQNLLKRMQAMEPFPSRRGDMLKGNDTEDNYLAAKQYMETLKAAGVDNNFRSNILEEYKPKLEPIFILEDRGEIRLGTLSKEEWEAITLYCVFAFKKKS